MPDALIELHNWSQFRNVGEIFSVVITVLLTFISVLGLLALIFGGYQYITSAGNPENTAKAKSTITWGIIGLIVAFASYIIVNLITSSLTR